ncbi:hypothetical protein PR002_g24018 [Phytophthora rubi]|uniref:Uncharacterized protein n=1 Tax=Phytophthora rubi TaxID=129364 RepID=A0A6A3ICL8_9STRA|nr:hypothetical protein PR002_g24018 [Phytophthora rubi]
MTTETRIIVRPARNALRAVGPTKPNADAPTPSDMGEKPPAPASKKHSGDPEAAKDASASKKPADATATANEASASTKKVAASSKPAPKKPVMKKPAAKQLPKKKVTAKESPKAMKLPPKRTDRLSDTDIPNPGYVSGADSPVPRTRASTNDNAASANDATTSPPGRSPSPHPSWEVDYEESEPDIDHEVERSPKQITDAQRVLHPGSPMSPKTVVAVERARLLEASMSRRDGPPAVVLEPQVITNAAVDEGVPLELLQNRQHLADRTHQEASGGGHQAGSRDPRPSHPRPATRAAILDSGRIPGAPSSESHAWPRRAAVRQVSGRASCGHRFLPPTE